MADEPERRPIAALCCARLLLPLLRPLARLICHNAGVAGQVTISGFEGARSHQPASPDPLCFDRKQAVGPSLDHCRLAEPTPLENNRGKTLLHARCAPWRLASDPSDATLPLPVAQTKRVPRSLSKGRNRWTGLFHTLPLVPCTAFNASTHHAALSTLAQQCNRS